jgi:anti-anti-sigma factor
MGNDSRLMIMQVGKYSVVEFYTPSLMDPAELESISRQLHLLVDKDNRRWILLDMTQVQYISSQFVGILVSLQKKLSELSESKLVLCGVGPRLTELLKITQLDRLLTVKATQSEVTSTHR